MNITIVGTGYVGLANAVLLAQHNNVIALDLVPEKVERLNNRQSPTNYDLQKFKNSCSQTIAKHLVDDLEGVAKKESTRELFQSGNE